MRSLAKKGERGRSNSRKVLQVRVNKTRLYRVFSIRYKQRTQAYAYTHTHIM